MRPTIVRCRLRAERIRFRKLCFIVFSVAMILVASVASQEHPDMQAVPFTLKTLEGKEYSLQEFLTKQRIVVVFWSTWGKDSGRVLGDMEMLFQKYGGKGLAVIGICVEEQNISSVSRQKIADSIQRNQITFPVVLDEGLQTFRAYSVIAVPTVYVIGKRGTVLHKLSGYPVSARARFREYIAEQFDGKQTPSVIVREVQPAIKEAIPLYKMARAKLEQGQFDLARRYAERTMRLDSLFVGTYNLLAEIAFEEDSLATAERMIESSLSLTPGAIDALRLKGLLLARMGNVQGALDILSPLARTDSLSVMTRCCVGYALGIGGDCAGALSEFSRAEAIARDDYHIPLLRAEVYRQCGMHEEAKREANALRTARKNR